MLNDPHQAFATLASTALVAANLFLDILSTSPSQNAYSCLRAEAAATFDSPALRSDPATLKKLVLADSALKESLRRSSIQTRGLLRAVVARDGFDLLDGTHLPKGTWLGVPVEAVHMDERFYDGPDEYDPFRFARMREKEGAVEGNKIDATGVSDRFLPWSYGRYVW